ncbi:alanine dehydrogenase [Halotalea alkalilenta]|uniref:Alanine dehydrogenase n=1 Tax=Halotalea alkalilenta TaxID=376489 RepID=A0A172YKS0_9GAMM|nr:alanine dehydrogenase [Halotalea alkalilenta]ANF59780.1 alanine dehydrogenase [Halotalea alkalilenta]
MKIALPKEIKSHEYRVALTPSGVGELVARGHRVMVERGAGAGAGFSDAEYGDAGAELTVEVDRLWSEAELIVKVKEPQRGEVARLGAGQMLFTYLHLAADRALTEGLLESRATSIAYETVTDAEGRLPLLAPMSRVAGRMSVQAGAHSLERAQGGAGILISGVPGVAPAKVTVIGAGVVGENAARMALGLGAEVSVFDLSLARLEALDQRYGGRLRTVYSTQDALAAAIRESDLVIGAVLVPGAAAPKLVKRAQLAQMRPGSVLVDVAIDQGGCFETSRPTTHDNPTYLVDGINHYCVANMPGAVPRTATQALTSATLPYVAALADKGWRRAFRENGNFLSGLNAHEGVLTRGEIAAAFGLEAIDSRALIR